MCTDYLGACLLQVMPLSLHLQLAVTVHDGGRPEVPPSSQLPGGGSQLMMLQEFVTVMRHCWHQDPHERPDFRAVIAMLRWAAVATAANPG